MRVQIMKLERRNNSVNGNPKYEIYWLDDNGYLEHATTKSDAMFCYGITNNIWSEDKPQVWADIEITRGGKVGRFEVVSKMWESN